MKRGSTKLILSIFLLFFYSFPSQSEDKILSSPLINLKKLKPSFEGIDNSTNDTTDVNKIKNRIKILPKNNTLSAKLIGLDKITAKTLEITVNLGEIKKFGPLEIKILKCGKIEIDSKDVSVAYLQVKDFTENQNEKIFIFNGWTFSSDPTIAPFDHAIYDLQLVNCNNA
jgi:hypothetical protein|tara:strand:- start:1205 stop:1714 length:510 start_codon:yes stop_codon:yes gene_type:complete